MPAYSACQSTTVPASPEVCFGALTAYGTLPQWQSAVKAITVVERDEQGRGRVINYEVDAKVARVRYRLEQHYEEPRLIRSRYLGGDFADMQGEWRLEPGAGGSTRAAFDLSIDPGRMVPRPVRRMLSNAVVRGALKDLGRHVAALPPTKGAP